MWHRKFYVFLVIVIFSYLFYNFSPFIQNYRVIKIVEKRIKYVEDFKILNIERVNGVKIYVVQGELKTIDGYCVVGQYWQNGFRFYQVIATSSSNSGGYSIQPYKSGVLIYGVKEVNEIKKIKMIFKSGQIIVLNVEDKPYFLYYIKDYRDPIDKIEYLEE